MSFNDQKKFERYIRLGLTKFSGAIGENANEFLINFQEKLHNLGSF